MNRDRWQAVNSIFHAALELPASERGAFVYSAARGDADLQSEVDRLLAADAQAASYLESPLLPADLFPDFESSPAPFRPGEMLKNRFQILRMVGEGGMGHVFEAFDCELNVRIALKAIRPEIAGNPAALEFFRREVRIARTITHPNVCRTFDLDRGFLANAPEPRSEFFFLTMEFLEGETLSARLKRSGPIPPAIALALARQIGAALSAAHQAGIVHRDIKPANIMLVDSAQPLPGTRAVITDFGLARRNPLHSPANSVSISHAGIIGTLAYMAPEQLESGQPVTAATDIYAFGLVLYEMITGLRAFPSANLLSGIAQRLSGSPPSLRAVVPDLPERWEQVIQGCLRIAPSERFTSAGEVVEALGGAAISLPPNSQIRLQSARPAQPRWTHARKIQFSAAILLLLLSLSFIGLRLFTTRADSKVAPGALVFLAPVRNNTGDRSLDNLTELLRASLSQSAQISLLDQSLVGDTLQRMTKSPETPITEPIAREIALRTGAVRVLIATISGSTPNYSLTIDIQQPDNTPSQPRNDWSKTFHWETSGLSSGTTIPAELLTAVRTSSDWIRSNAGESANDIARLDIPPGDVTTKSWDALADYANAQKLFAQGRKDEGIEQLKDAVRLDPDFALAYAAIGDNLVSQDKRQEGYRAYLTALNESSGNRLSRKERDFIRGSFAADTGDYQTALAAFRDDTAFYENDFYGWFYQAEPLERLDRPQDAITILLRAEAISGERHAAAGELVYPYLMLGDYSEAKKWIEIVHHSGRTDFATYLSGIDQFLEGSYSTAETTFTRLEKSNSEDFRTFGYSLRARVEAEQGRYADSLATIADESAAFEGAKNKRGMQQLDAAYIQCHQGQFSSCLSRVDEALQLNPAPNSILWASTIIGESLPSLDNSDRRRAIAALQEMKRLLPEHDHELGLVYDLAGARVEGELLLAQGNAKAALAAFRRADNLDAPLSAREYLGRGLLAAAATEKDRVRVLALKSEALQAYGKAALRPAALWQNPWEYPPGFLADQMTSYLVLAQSLHRDDASIEQVQRNLSNLRGHAPPSTSLLQ
jgi:serine/threonine protein kinase/tetratricopeptide (TPR) repeat protein